jgi:predicted flap endonuclease-1-like 5' DNA nuclease
MLNFIREWLPVICFLFGTALGWLISTFFENTRRKYLEDLYRKTQRNNILLENQLTRKSGLEEELGKTNYELERLRGHLKQMSQSQKQEHRSDIENLTLRKEIKKLQSENEPKESSSSKDYISDYQSFLEDLEQSVQKAKRIAFDNPSSQKESKKGSKKKKSNKSKSDKFEFYKEKYKGKQFSISDLNGVKKTKDLTYLYGIDEKVQALLNENEIKTFADLSNTKIGELRAILALAGGNYELIDPLNWPIQARLAEKGKWEILEEYKRKMEM